MYSLVIADDNPIIINGLKKLPFSDLSITLKGICQDGNAAAQFIKNNNPDIVITDIEMPGLNGIELIRDVLSSGINPKFIILSGHDEFSFAQEAISLGVINYLLKPVVPDQLVASLKKAVSLLNSEANAQNLINSTLPFAQEVFLDELLRGKTYTEPEFLEKCRLLNMPLENKHFRCISLKRITQPIPDNLALAQICSLLDNIFPNNYSKAFDDETIYFLIYSDNKLSDEKLALRLNELLSEIQHLYDSSVLMGISSESADFKEISTLFAEAGYCMTFDLFMPNTRLLFFNELVTETIGLECFQDFDRQKFEGFLADKDFTTAQFYIKSFINTAKKSSCPINHTKLFTANVFYFTSRQLSASAIYTERIDLSKQINSIISTESYDRLVLLIDETFNTLRKNDATTHNSNSKLIENVIAYTRINYAKNLTVQKLADIFYVSPTHLRNTFVEHTGTTYKEYLTSLRMKEAYSLLSTGDYKVYEVASMVGYKKIDHFSKLYKQYYGTTPTKR